MNSPPLRLLYGLPGTVHRLGIGMGQGADYGLPHLLGDEADLREYLAFVADRLGMLLGKCGSAG